MVVPSLEELKAGACPTPLIMPQPAQADLWAGFQALPVPNTTQLLKLRSRIEQEQGREKEVS